MALLATAMLVCTWSSGILGAVAGAAEPIPFAQPVERTDPRAKIASAIRAFIDVAAGPQGIDARLRALTVPASRPDLICVRLDVQVTDATVALIAATGVRILSSSVRWNSVVAEATMAQIDALAKLPEVHLVAPAYRPRHQAASQPGTYTDPADSVIHTDQVRSNFAVTGAGQTIGVISDSINATSKVGAGTVTGTSPGVLKGTKPQGTGDLPSSIMVCDITNNGGTTDEGEAMMEEAYHLAPGAAFAFAPCGQSDTDMASNIGLLGSQAKCSIICDDIIFLDEPMFQDGPIAQAAANFVKGGGLYLTAAGNNANYGILATYSAVLATADPHTNGFPNGNAFTNWGISGSTPGFLPITIPAQVTVDIILEWNQPFQSFGLGAGSASDLNLWLYSATNVNQSSVITQSVTVQGTAASPSGDPVEIVEYTNPNNTPITIYVAVDCAGGVTANQVMRLIFFTDGPTVTSPGNSLLNFATSMGHQTVANVMTIAAMDYSTTPFAVESFSSMGGWGINGVPYYFDKTGNLLPNAPVRLNKPDITAPDGVSVSPNKTFKPFFGTSGATPHAAAAAALSWCAQPTLTNLQIISALQTSATDITVSPASTGPDAWSGFGLVNALASVGISATSVSSITTTTANGTYASGIIPILITFTNPVTVTGNPMLALNTTPPVSATYVSGSGTTQLTFSFTIAPGETDSKLEYANASALSGGTWSTGSFPALSLTLPAPGTNGSLSFHSSIAIDSRIAQTITFTNAATMSYGSQLTLTATVSSGLMPTFSLASGPATLSGAVLTPTGTGSVVVKADQAGNGTYLAAPQASQTITVVPAADSVNIPSTTTVVYSASPSPVTVTVTGPAATGATVLYQPWSGNPASGGSSTGAATTTAPTVVGWYKVTASLDGNHGGGIAIGGLSITPALLTVTATSQSIAYGNAAVLGSTTTGFLGTDNAMVITGSIGLSTSATASSPMGTYPITVDVSKLSASNYTFTGVNGILTITPAAATINLPSSPIIVAYTATPHVVSPTLGGAPAATATVAYQLYNGNPLLTGSPLSAASSTAPTNAGWYLVVATLGSNFGGASAQTALHITPAVLTVTAVSQSIVYGAGPAGLTATMATFLGTDSSSAVSGTVSLSTTANAASPTGTYPIIVSVSGLSAANYTFVGSNGSVVISQAAQTITFPNPGTAVNGQGQIPLVATASSGLGVTFALVSGPATLSGSVLTITGAGTVVVEAEQSGTADYLAAPSVQRSITITKSTQIITFAAIGNQTVGVAPLTLTATASSGLTPSLSIVSGPGTLSGSILTITGPGTVVIAADQAGNGSFLPAPEVTQSITVAPAAGSTVLPAVAATSGGGSHSCGLGSGFGALLMALAVLGRVVFLRLRPR